MGKTFKQKWIVAFAFMFTFALTLSIFMSVGSITAHADEEISAPTNLCWNGNVAEWDAVEGAVKYRWVLEVSSYGMAFGKTAEGYVTETSVDLTDLLVGKNGYRFDVRALDSEDNSSSVSAYSPEKLMNLETVAVTGFVWSDTTVGWTAVSGADGYNVWILHYIDGVWHQVGSVKKTTADSVDVNSFVNNVDGNGGDGQYKVCVRPYKISERNYFGTGESTEKTFVSNGAAIASLENLSATINQAITPFEITITLIDNTFESSLGGNWVQILPSGLSQSITRISDTQAKITISGTPTTLFAGSFSILIPASCLTKGNELWVTGTTPYCRIVNYNLINSISVQSTLVPESGKILSDDINDVTVLGEHYTVSSIGWMVKEGENWDWAPNVIYNDEGVWSPIALPGKTYRLMIYLSTDNGYEFDSNYNMTATFNGEIVSFDSIFIQVEFSQLENELIFVKDRDYEISSNDIGITIAPLNVSLTVWGGTTPYSFSKTSGPSWVNVSSSGEITGTRPNVPQSETTLVVRVSDNNSSYKEISINVGKVKCDHSDCTQYVANDATCTQPGNVYYVHCNICNKNFNDYAFSYEVNPVISALGHSMNYHAVVNSTCCSNGTLEHYHCNRCNEDFADNEGLTKITDLVILATNAHSSDEWLTDNDKHWKVCSVGGTVFAQGTHTPDRTEPTETLPVKCLICDKVLQNALGHTCVLSETVERVEPTCSNTGNIKYYVCSCGKKYSNLECSNEIINDNDIILSKLSHNYESTKDNSYHWEECTDCHDVRNKVAHDFIYSDITTAPTHTTKGVKTFTCECGATRTEDVPMLAVHSYGDWQSDDTKHWKECECGDKTEESAHSFVWIIDVEPQIGVVGKKHEECSVCDFTRNENIVIDALAHTHNANGGWQHDNTNHWHNCDGCDEQLGKDPHSFGDWAVMKSATTTEKGEEIRTCACGYAETREIEKLPIADKPTEPKKEGLSGGAIAGIVVGSTAVVGLGGFSIFWFVIKKKKFADLIAIFKKK